MTQLYHHAQELSQSLPDIWAQAQHISRSMSSGLRNQSRAGAGEQFWQYRPLQAYDDAKRIDWRRSARSDDAYIKEREWQNAQRYSIWVDQAKALQFQSPNTPSSKYDRAALIALTCAMMLTDHDDHVSWAEAPKRSLSPRQLALTLSARSNNAQTYGHVPQLPPQKQTTALLFSDYLAPFERLSEQISMITQSTKHSILIQILDPQELTFSLPTTQRLRTQDVASANTGTNTNTNTGTYIDIFDPKSVKTTYLETFKAHQKTLKDICHASNCTLITHVTHDDPRQILTDIFTLNPQKSRMHTAVNP